MDFALSREKLRVFNAEFHKKRSARSTIFLATPPPMHNMVTTAYRKNICAAVTMSGTQCKNKAVCKGFCNSHASAGNAVF